MNEQRIQIYAFLSRIYADVLDQESIEELGQQGELLDQLGPESRRYFAMAPDSRWLYEQLNTDFTSLFVMNNPPMERAVTDNGSDIYIGLENPVMQFYLNHGYELNMNATHLMTPDHLALELGFMEAMIRQNDTDAQKEFLATHLGHWAPPFLLGCKRAAQTPFYQEICDFAAEFLISDYAALESV